MTGLEPLVEKTALNLGGMGQQLMRSWQGLSPHAQHTAIGGGVGALGGLLSGGADETGETHRMRNMMLGAGAGAAAGHFGGQGISNLMQGRQWGGAIPQGPSSMAGLPQLAQQSQAFPKLSSAFEQGKTAAWKRFGLAR